MRNFVGAPRLVLLLGFALLGSANYSFAALQAPPPNLIDTSTTELLPGTKDRLRSATDNGQMLLDMIRTHLPEDYRRIAAIEARFPGNKMISEGRTEMLTALWEITAKATQNAEARAVKTLFASRLRMLQELAPTLACSVIVEARAIPHDALSRETNLQIARSLQGIIISAGRKQPVAYDQTRAGRAFGQATL